MTCHRTKRYPREKVARNGVNRCWMLEHLSEAKYPRLALALITAVKNPCQIAAEARISEDVLLDVVFGRDDLTCSEWHDIADAFRNSVGVPPCVSWLQAPDVYYDSAEDTAELLQAINRAFSFVSASHPAHKPGIELLKMRPMPHEAAVFAFDFMDMGKAGVRRAMQTKPRCASLSNGCT